MLSSDRAKFRTGDRVFLTNDPTHHGTVEFHYMSTDSALVRWDGGVQTDTPARLLSHLEPHVDARPYRFATHDENVETLLEFLRISSKVAVVELEPKRAGHFAEVLERLLGRGRS